MRHISTWLFFSSGRDGGHEVQSGLCGGRLWQRDMLSVR